MTYFKALDRMDCIIAIWRYLFIYKDTQLKGQEGFRFIDGMSDFFTNKRLKEDDLFVKNALFLQMIAFLTDKAKAKRYTHGESIETLFIGDKKIAHALKFLIEAVPMFCTDQEYANKNDT